MFAQFTIFLIASLSAGILATALAHAKRRTWLLWGIMSMFFPPAVLVLLFLPVRDGPPPYEQEYTDDNDIEDAYDDGRRDRGGLFW